MLKMGDSGKQLFMDFIPVSKARKRFSFSNFLLLLVKSAVAMIFSPVFILFGIIESKFFLKLFKRVVFAIYLFLVGLGIYTFTTRNRIIKSTKKILVEIDFHDKIKEFK
ncbi:MAG: hypothetical protein LBP39_02320 [Rickettsiales bacterium]|nr:hypothetical protein [Rickettsiales bacterium]